MSVFKKFFALFLMLILTQSCRNYESDEYKSEEHTAYQQLISEFTRLTKLSGGREDGVSKSILYLVSELVNEVQVTPEYIQVFDDPNDRTTYSEELEQKTIEEYKHFKPLQREHLKVRKLNDPIAHDQLQVKLISRKEYEDLTTDGLNSEFVKNPELFGYLFLSRIVFDRDYFVGYLNYMFYCGTGCFWTNNVEISKVNGNWTITKHYSGGIA